MIVFDLKCRNGHAFEAWFANGAAYDKQAKNGTVVCPACGNTKVTKAPMAPNVVTRKEVPRRAPGSPAMATKGEYEKAVEVARAMNELRAQVEKNCTYVGEQFAEEARKIHYGETDQKNIYGRTTPAEAKELREEGIEFGVLPWPARTDS
ncbi:MAG: DUF1178 family protein [Alphaproteobacteria bacterium]|nr:DUF1178 family protein [Alphaproteobacteria bacterium]